MTIAKNNLFVDVDQIILKDWLVATGTQYFNLELLPSKNLEFETDIMIDTDRFTYSTLVPCGSGFIDEQNNVNRFYPCAVYVGNWHFAVGNEYSVISGVQISTEYHVKSVFNENDFEGYVNGSLVYSGKIRVPSLNTVELGMFCNRRKFWNGVDEFVINESFYGKMGHTTIKINGKAVRDLHPCVTVNDNTACMYDAVQHKLYQNQGTGQFTAM